MIFAASSNILQCVYAGMTDGSRPSYLARPTRTVRVEDDNAALTDSESDADSDTPMPAGEPTDN